MRKKYTAEEEAIIAEEISKSPDNIKKGIRSAAEKIRRSECAVSAHWYTVQSKKGSSKAVFLTMGKTSCTVNRKNIYSEDTDSNKVKLLSKSLFKGLLKRLGLN